MNLRWIVPGLLAFLPLGAFADEACHKPVEVAGFEGEQDFVQTRWFKGVSNPLISSGTITLSEDSVKWAVLEPVSIVTTVTEGGIVQSVEGGPPERVSGGQSSSPLLEQSGLFDLLKGDLSRVDQFYSVSAPEPVDNGWSISLVPSDAKMREFVDRITVKGCRRVSNIHVVQSSGDTLEIAFPVD